jgi:hypothetical protein
VVCVDRFEILRFVLVDCPAEEALFMYCTELAGLQKNMKAMISVLVTVHVKANISTCIFLYVDIQMVCTSVQACPRICCFSIRSLPWPEKKFEA